MSESTALPCCAPLRLTKNSNMRLNDVAHNTAAPDGAALYASRLTFTAFLIQENTDE